MGDRSECRLGDIVTFQRGFDITKKEQVPGAYPVVSSSGIKSYHNMHKVRSPGVVVGRKGTLGTVFYLNTDFWPHDTTLWVRNFHGNYPLFVFYFLKEFHFEQYDVGSSNPTLNRNHIHLLPSTIPPLPEQKAIASVLSSLDDKIDLLHRQNKTLEAMAETLFRQWFVVEAQEDWEEGITKDLIEILSGFPFKSSSFVENGKYRLITIKGVQDGYLDKTNAARINDIPSRMPNYCLLQNRDILLSLTGNVGRCCLVDSNDLLLNQRVAKLQPKNNRDWAFTYILFRQIGMKKALEDLAKGTAQANLSPIELADMQLQIPSEYLIGKFSEEVTPLLGKVMSNKSQIHTLEKLRDTLLPKLMGGEVRVEYEN